MPSVAVIDVETTGLAPYRNDRIVELAVLVVSPDGTILREFETLVNPERDIGPTRLHGLVAGDVLNAPRFGEIAGELVEVLSGCVAIAGHNVRFDRSFLEAEFGRLGCTFPGCPLLCTMQLAGGGGLSRACSDYGIRADAEAHLARNDARATAQLFMMLLRDAPRLVAEISHWPAIGWPDIRKHPVKALTREASRRRADEVPSYLEVLLSRVQRGTPPDSENSAILEYTALLDRVIEDRQVDEAEGQALHELAERWAIPSDRIRGANRDYLVSLAVAAWADGVVTAPERRDLQRVASLVGIDRLHFEEILDIASKKPVELQPRIPSVVGELDQGALAGKLVCFTGESQCRLNREAITREMAAEIARGRGMVVKESVTKKLDVLVVADPDTQSGKAKKARQYGIRIINERVFWRTLGLKVE